MACKWLACCPQNVRDIFFTCAQLQVDPSGKMCSLAGDDFEAGTWEDSLDKASGKIMDIQNWPLSGSILWAKNTGP